METRVMLTMGSRIHGDMYVRFGGRLVETYHRKVAKRCWPSLLKEIADVCGINKKLTTHTARHTFATLLIADHASIKNVAAMMGHSSVKMTERYARVQDYSILYDMEKFSKNI